MRYKSRGDGGEAELRRDAGGSEAEGAREGGAGAARETVRDGTFRRRRPMEVLQRDMRP